MKICYCLHCCNKSHFTTNHDNNCDTYFFFQTGNKIESDIHDSNLPSIISIVHITTMIVDLNTLVLFRVHVFDFGFNIVITEVWLVAVLSCFWSIETDFPFQVVFVRRIWHEWRRGRRNWNRLIIKKARGKHVGTFIIYSKI